jgi:hypothetical protein
VHALVAGGALTGQGTWVSPKRGFLFPVHALSRVFRGKFMEALTARRREAPLKCDEALRGSFWRRLIAELYRHEWVVYAKEPLGGPAQVLEYLGHYTHRVAISNERILGITKDSVRLCVRDPTRPNGRRVIELPGEAFIARFLTHVLPRGFKRIRHYGLLGPAKKKAHLAAARAVLNAPAPNVPVVESVDAFMRRVARIDWTRCPTCATGQFVVLEAIAPAPVRLPIPRAPP